MSVITELKQPREDPFAFHFTSSYSPVIPELLLVVASVPGAVLTG